jgi:hypothetical protein
MRSLIITLAVATGIVAGCAAPLGDEKAPEANIETVKQAAVSVDAATGSGFVGKGDVQLAFGYNNAQLQAAATAINFEQRRTDVYDTVCSWEIETTVVTENNPANPASPRATHTRTKKVTITGTTALTDTLAYEVVVSSTQKKSTQKQWTGFNLTGFGASNADAPPQVGDACEGDDDAAGTLSEVIKNDAESTRELYVTHGDRSAPLPNTPVL